MKKDFVTQARRAEKELNETLKHYILDAYSVRWTADVKSGLFPTIQDFLNGVCSSIPLKEREDAALRARAKGIIEGI